ncbi:uncharacterized protein LOC144538504 [Centroberyx gerrardi]
MNGSTVSKDLASEVQTTACQVQLENDCSKLDTILEVSLAEADDSPVLQTQKDTASNFTHNPVDQLSDTATKQHTQKQPSGSAEVNDELSPEGLHGNQAPGCYFSQSPASEVADGQREHHRPGATLSGMEEMDEAAQTVIYSDTHLANPLLDGTSELGDQKEDNMVKMRVRKHEHSRLDSMVLLLMKLDQLDQEIENALSATSSMDSTPTLRRRQLLVETLETGLGCSFPKASSKR